jgi:hypothetical protein
MFRSTPLLRAWLLLLVSTSWLVNLTQGQTCGCDRCTDDVLNTLAGSFTCAERMDFLRSPAGGSLPELAACQVITDQYPRVCGPSCNPTKCDGQDPNFCGCADCTDSFLDLDAGGFTCFERIQGLRVLGMTEVEACQDVANDYPRTCGPACNPSKCDGKAPDNCGCNECIDFVLDMDVDGFTCFERIQAVQREQEEEEEDACRSISDRFPQVCGPACHPDKCDGGPLFCGCFNCTQAIWDTPTFGGPTCGARIRSLQLDEGFSEMAACETIATDYPVVCGPHCHPNKCDDQPPFCGCVDCVESIWETEVEGFTCGARIRSTQITPGLIAFDRTQSRLGDEEGACAAVADEYPLTCGPQCHPSKCDNRGPAFCGCNDCTRSIFDTLAGNFTCGERILSLLRDPDLDFSEEEACGKVANEFPDVCGPDCHPDRCDGQPLYCGCYNCTQEVWDTNAGGEETTCGSRIAFGLTFDGDELSEPDSCRRVSLEFRSKCGQFCHPDFCDGQADFLPSASPVRLGAWRSFGTAVFVAGVTLWTNQ